jgi:hypothetical protein
VSLSGDFSKPRTAAREQGLDASDEVHAPAALDAPLIVRGGCKYQFVTVAVGEPVQVISSCLEDLGGG